MFKYELLSFLTVEQWGLFKEWVKKQPVQKNIYTDNGCMYVWYDEEMVQQFLTEWENIHGLESKAGSSVQEDHAADHGNHVGNGKSGEQLELFPDNNFSK